MVEALDENYDTQTTTAECHYNPVSDSEEEPSNKDLGDSETSEDEGETKAKDVEETKILELTNLEPAREMLELARNGTPNSWLLHQP